jgi:twinkle protein
MKMPHSCGSSDALQIFENEDGTLSGYCFACDTYESDPLGEGKTIKDIPKKQLKIKSKDQILEEMKEISELAELVDLKQRRIRSASLEYFGCKIGFSQIDGKTPNIIFFPYTKGGEIVKYKCRLLERKSMWSVGIDNDVDLFGWEQAKASGAKRLVITEGEYDAIALRRILEIHTKDQFKDHIPAVCSLPNGAGSAGRDMARLLPEIRRHFKDIALAFDQDEAGAEAEAEVCKLCPEAKAIALPAKDANDCLIKGMGKAAHKAVAFNSEKVKNTRLVWGRDIHEQAKKAAEWGLSWPWKSMTEKTRGIRFGETIYIAAGEKMGKSEVVNALAKHLAVDHKLKVMLAKPEEANTKTYKMLNSKVTGRIFHDPTVEFDEEAYEEGGNLIKDNVCMLNLYQNITWEVLRSDIYSAVSEGVKAVFIDPITNLTNGLHTSEINEKLQGVAQELASMAKDLDIVIFIFCHLNKPSKGSTPWDRGGKITTDYFAGSSAMARSCNYALGLEGDKNPDLTEQERNMRQLVILADREFGESGSCSLYWDYKTGLFNEI